MKSTTYNDRNIRIQITYCLVAIFTFLAGITIYIFFRTHDIFLFQILPKSPFLNEFHISVNANNMMISMFLFNLPDGLWFLSGLLMIRAIWLKNPRWRVIYFGIFTLIALSMETSQIFINLPGTFDALDIVFMIFFAFAENMVFNKFFRRCVL